MHTEKTAVAALLALLLSFLLPMACHQAPPTEAPPPTVTLSGHILSADGRAPKKADISFPSRPEAGTGLQSFSADEAGAFSVALPKGVALALHITAVDHEESVLPVLLDSDATLEIQLRPNPFKESFDSVRIMGSWNHYSLRTAAEMKARKDGSFLWEGESTEETVGYELAGITTNGHWVNGTMAEAFEYDRGGDYRSLVHPAGGKIQIVFDPKLLPKYSDEGLPKVSFDENHEELEQMAVLAIDASRSADEAQHALMDVLKSGGNPEDFHFDASGLKNELLMAIGHGTSPMLRRYAAVLLASNSLQFSGFELSRDELQAIRDNAPAASRVWSFKHRALHAVSKDHPNFLKDALKLNPDTLVQREALTGLIHDAVRRKDMDSARKYYARLKKDYGKLSGSSYMLRELNPDKRVAVGKIIPDFSLKLMDGTPITQDDLKGHWTLIDFWATWCSPCVAEMPNLQAAWEKFHSEGFEILSLSLDASPEDVKKFRGNKFRMPWKHAFLDGGFDSETANQFEILGIPQPLLISPDGKVVAMPPETRGEKLLNTIESAIHTADKDAGHE